jgi:putative transcription factor
MSEQDWTVVTLKKSDKQKAKEAFTDQRSLAQAKASGVVAIEKKHAAGENKSAHAAPAGNLRKLEESTDEYKHQTVNKNLAQAIVQARLAKKLTQAQLATMINERAQIIQQYESGQAIPNGQILGKLDRALGTHLPRK